MRKRLFLAIIPLTVISSLLPGCSSLVDSTRKSLLEGDKPQKTKQEVKWVSKDQYDKLMERYKSLSDRYEALKEESLEKRKGFDQANELAQGSTETIDVFKEDDQAGTQVALSDKVEADVGQQLAYYKKGLALKQNGRIDEALKIFQFLEKSPTKQISVRAKKHIGEIYFSKKQFDLSLQVYELDYDEFEDISRKAFVKTAVDYEKELFSKDNYRHINLLRMRNPPPLIDVSRLKHVTDNKLYRLKVSNDKAAITQYLKGDKFKPYIRHVHSRPILNSRSYELYRKRPNGILIELRKRGQIDELKRSILESTSSVQKNMLVVKVEKNALELKKIYEEAYSQYLNDISLVGNILYIELQQEEYVSFFKERLENAKQQFADFGEVHVNQCDYFSCLDLKGTGLNLIPFLEKSPQIFIDTYLGLNKLVRNDFTFHGFIEIEVELSLPL